VIDKITKVDYLTKIWRTHRNAFRVYGAFEIAIS
jgi:hypothetical protein